jgi:hypothetical protein
MLAGWWRNWRWWEQEGGQAVDGGVDQRQEGWVQDRRWWTMESCGVCLNGLTR